MGMNELDITSMVADAFGYHKEKQSVEAERQKVFKQIDRDEKEKSNLVKKALAGQRAKYGAGGMTGKGMTEEAVLKRLREEIEEPYNEKKEDSLNYANNLDKPVRRNLLKKYFSLAENSIKKYVF